MQQAGVERSGSERNPEESGSPSLFEPSTYGTGKSSRLQKKISPSCKKIKKSEQAVAGSERGSGDGSGIVRGSGSGSSGRRRDGRRKVVVGAAADGSKGMADL